MVLVLLALLLLLPGGCLTLRLSLNRTDTLAMLGEQETQVYFNFCELSSSSSSCIFAIDSSASQEPTQCALNDPANDHWWIGNLEMPAYVTKVTVLSMDPSFKSIKDALTRMTILANDEVCIQHTSAEATFTKWTFPCDVIAETITIRSSVENSVLAICDVEVLGAPLKFPTILGENQLLKPQVCLMSSVDGNGYCENAFDGDTRRNHQQKACAVSAAEDKPWLEARLAKPSFVLEVKVFSRGDCCGDSLTNFAVDLDKRLYDLYIGPAFEFWSFRKRRFGSRLLVRGELSVPLAVCEIQILGHEAKLVEVEKFKPLGCHNDNMFDRDMTQLASGIRMSLGKCHRACKRMGLKYFAVQKGILCYCGNAFGKHGVADNKTCSYKCDAEPSEICGGEIQSNVFEIL